MPDDFAIHPKSKKMHTLPRFLFPALFLCLFGLTVSQFAACSSQGGTSQTAEATKASQPTMPTNFSRKASDTLSKLSAYVPSGARALCFASYGSLGEAIVDFEKLGVVQSADMQKTLSDLRMHYKLNPAELSSWYQAGFHTGSGFVAGLDGDSIFMVLDVLDVEAFRAWWTNFLTEEYGRPVFTEETSNGATFVHAKTMNRDAATLILRDGAPVVLVAGEALYGGAPSSLEKARAIAGGGRFDAGSMRSVPSHVSDAPIAAWSLAGTPFWNMIPSDIRPYVTQASVGVRMSGALDLQIAGQLSNEPVMGTPAASYFGSLFGGSDGGWTIAIESSNPTSLVRAQVRGKALETVALAHMSSSDRSTYQSIKGKLTQSFLKLDVTDQVIHNIGSVWIADYGNGFQAANAGGMYDQNAAIFLPMADSSKSDGFFAKINLLKGAVPANMATITSEAGLLHAVANVAGGKKLHVGYSKGLLAVATAKSWDTVKRVFAKGKGQNVAFMHAVSARMQTHWIASILGTDYAMLKKFGTVNADADVRDGSMLVHVTVAK